MRSSPIDGRFGPTPGLDGVGTRAPVSGGQARIGELRGRGVQRTPDDVARDNRRVVVGFRANLALRYGEGIAARAFPQADALHRASAPLTRTAQATAVRLAKALATTPVPTPRGAIIDATQFKAIAGETRNIFMGGGYKSLLRALDSYQRDVVQDRAGLSDAQKLQRTGALQQQAQSFLASKETELFRKAGDAGDTARIEARMRGTMTLLQGLGEKSHELYGRLTGHDMSAARFVPENEVGVDAGFASGAMSSVDKIRYRDGTEGVFKAERRDGPMPHEAGRNTGIPERLADANMSGRAVATSKLDQALGLGLVPPTEFAVHGVRAGCVQEFARGGTLFSTSPVKADIGGDVDVMRDILDGNGNGLGHGTDEVGARRLAQVANARPEVRERAIGELMRGGHLWATREEATGMGRVDLAAPTVQKSLADAHVMDLLTGQVDRNPGNFIFHTGPDGQVRAKLIDNDLSFGARLTSLSHASLEAVESGVMLTRLPRLIDADTARRVSAMTPDTLRAALADTGLSGEEMDAATARLGQLQAHIRMVGRGEVEGGRLVDHWDAATFREQLAQPDNYVRRSIEDQDVQILSSSSKTAMLVDDVRANGARGLASLAATWDADKTGEILKSDIRAGGQLVKAMLEAAPRLLTEMLAKVSADDRAEVLRGYRSDAVTESPRAARNAADVAAELTRRGAGIPGGDGRPPMAGQELTRWTLNALLGKDPPLGARSPNADGTMAPSQLAELRAAAIHQAYTNGSLSLNMVDELIDPVRTQLAMHAEWNDSDLAAIDSAATGRFQAPRAVPLDADNGRSLAVHTVFSELGKVAGADPDFASYLRLLDDVGSRAMPAYNREGGRAPGAEKVVGNGPDFAREGAKVTPSLLNRLRAADTADGVRAMLREQGWEASARPRAELLAGETGAANGMNDFLARYLFDYAAEGRALT